jgi:hypothetical protein
VVFDSIRTCFFVLSGGALVPSSPVTRLLPIHSLVNAEKSRQVGNTGATILRHTTIGGDKGSLRDRR